MNPQHWLNDPTMDTRAKIVALSGWVEKRAVTEQVRRAARVGTGATRRKEAPTKIDWEAVAETERWLETEWAAGRTAYDGPPGAYDILPSAVPREVGQIGGVLLSRCAGYAKVPRPHDVAAAVAADTPTEEQWFALDSYLSEATTVEVRNACLAREIDLRKLMRRVEEFIENDGRCRLRGVRQWVTQ